MGLLDALTVFDWISPAISLARDARGSHIIAVCSYDGLTDYERLASPMGTQWLKRMSGP